MSSEPELSTCPNGTAPQHLHYFDNATGSCKWCEYREPQEQARYVDAKFNDGCADGGEAFDLGLEPAEQVNEPCGVCGSTTDEHDNRYHRAYYAGMAAERENPQPQGDGGLWQKGWDAGWKARGAGAVTESPLSERPSEHLRVGRFWHDEFLAMKQRALRAEAERDALRQLLDTEDKIAQQGWMQEQIERRRVEAERDALRADRDCGYRLAAMWQRQVQKMRAESAERMEADNG